MKKIQDICIRVIGVGNAQRSDDGVGIAVVRKLKEKLVDGVVCEEHDGDGAGLIQAFQGKDQVILVDAVLSGAKPGTIHRVEAHAISVPEIFFGCSSHWFGVSWAIEMARTLGTLPRRLLVYGIEGASFETGHGLSEPVAQAAEKLVSRLHREITHGKRQCTNLD